MIDPFQKCFKHQAVLNQDDPGVAMSCEREKVEAGLTAGKERDR